MTNSISAKPAIDTSGFKDGLRQMNSELRVLDSGFKASAAALGDWGKSTDGLELRSKSLTAQIEIQTRKVEATRAEWERVKATQGENSLAANKLETDLNKETEKLNKMGGELGETDKSLAEMKNGSDEAGNGVKKLGDETDKSGKKLLSFGDVLKGIGAAGKAAVAGIVAVGTAAVAAAAGVSALVFSAAKGAGELEDLSAKTGISTTSLQEFAFIGSQTGVALDTITGAQSRLIRSMDAGRDATKGVGVDFAKLGISVTDGAGNLRDSQTVFAETIDALGKIKDPTERDAAAMAIFGKSAQELNPLILEGSVGMAAMAAEGHKLGAVMSDEDVASLAAFDDMLAGLKLGLQGTMGTLATAFLPTFTMIFGEVGNVLTAFKDIVQGADGDFGKLAEGLGGLVEKIAKNIAKQAPKMLDAGLGIVKGILDAIISALPTMLTAASEIIKSLVGFISAALPSIIPAAVSILLMLVNTIISNLPMLISAALMAIIALAQGLSAALPELIPSIVSAVLLIVQVLIDNLPLLITAATMLIVALAQGLGAALPLLGEKAPEILMALGSAILASVPILLSAAGQIIMALARGLADYWQSMIPGTWSEMAQSFLANMIIAAALWAASIADQAQKIITAMSNGLKNASQIGKNFVVGVWNGIKGNIDWMLRNVMGFADSIVDAVKDALGIHSPSKKGVAVGKNLIESIALGAELVFPNVSKTFSAMVGQLTYASAQNGVAAFGGGGTTNEYNAYYAPVTIVSNRQAANGENAATSRRF